MDIQSQQKMAIIIFILSRAIIMIIAAIRIAFDMIIHRHKRSWSAIYSGISDGCLSPSLAKARPLRPPGGTCEQSAANALCERNI